jgi:hypothetical protein
MFGVVSGMMASVFLGQSKKEPVAIMDQLKRLEEKIEELNRKIQK